MVLNYQEKAQESLAEGDFVKAISYYSLAITREKRPSSIMYSERAKALLLSYTVKDTIHDLAFKQWKKITSDCDLALEIDANNLDAQYYKALSQVYGDKEGEAGLQSLYDVYSKSLKSNDKRYLIPKVIYERILEVRHHIGEREVDEQIVRSNALFSKLMKAIEVDYHNRIEEYNVLDLDKETHEYITTKLAMDYTTEVKDLLQIFKNNFNHALTKNAEEPPECLCDPIGFDLFVDPVITPSGNSFERSWLFDYLDKNHTDPFTRKKLKKSECYANIGLLDCVNEYRKTNKTYK